ncbi:hypothetical protein HMPREF9533_00241 [Escherichia coli MS 60-1]|nr:hypothetical protein HMPREF9553_04802 [Escherichia coli MS 200-1]EGB84872.1 hypothetical protein HMPREF9533_00241 [Escherichia coli MS 60-1]ESE30034.1 hypothetical protein HMPREF1622_03744 [Escherichia coli A35218R]
MGSRLAKKNHHNLVKNITGSKKTSVQSKLPDDIRMMPSERWFNPDG